MKRLVLFLAIACAATAAPICTNGSDVLAGAFSCSIGGLTFSNFSALDAGSNPTPSVTLVQATTAGGQVLLEFNPFLSANGGASSAIHFYFQVSGGITGVDLTVDGRRASIYELVCGNPLSRNTCGSSAPLASLAASSGVTTSATFASAANAYVFKDIMVTSGTAAGDEGHLTSFFQSFMPGGGGGPGGGVIPEPSTYLTLGSGLLLTAILWKRRMKKT